jgi:putative acetyltransferase
MDLRPLGAEDASAVADLAARDEVVRFGEHSRETSRLAWPRWMGASDPNTGITLGAFEGRELVAALRLALNAQRRRMHGGVFSLLASVHAEGDAPLEALLSQALGAADRWHAALRTELRCPAEHPRVDGLFAALGFAREARLVRSIAHGASLGDEVLLSRVSDRTIDPYESAPIEPPRGTRAKVTVRNARAADAGELAATMSEPSVVWGTLQLPYQRTDRWLERLAASDPTRIVFLIAEVEGKLAGGGALTRFEEPRRSHAAKLGMHVSLPYQGRGVGRALMRALLERAELQLGLSRVELSVYPDNTRAIRLYENAGFVHEGRARRASFRDGGYVDDLLMARLA